MKWDSKLIIDSGYTIAKIKNSLLCSYTVISDAVKYRNVGNFDVG